MVTIILDTIIRTIGVYALAIFLSRLVGRKLISQMTFFDFVVGVSMGAVSANAMIGPKSSPVSAVTALVTVSLLAVGVSYLHIKNFRVKKLVNSEPVTLVNKGIIVEDNMKRIRLTVSELMMKLREKNAFNLADVEFAIMETDGQLSVLPKSDKKPLTPYDMDLKPKSTGLERDIIIDGKLIKENLSAADLNENWLFSQLSTHNIKEVSEVFYAGIDNSKILYVSRKNSGNSESHGKYGLE